MLKKRVKGKLGRYDVFVNITSQDITIESVDESRDNKYTYYADLSGWAEKFNFVNKVKYFVEQAEIEREELKKACNEFEEWDGII